MQLVLRDLNPDIVLALHQAFRGEPELSVGSGDLLAASVDAIVSPANSFGRMGGGIDLHYRNYFGRAIQARLEAQIEASYENGELPVGEALPVATGHPKIAWMIVAPTMRLPGSSVDPGDIRRAMLAALRCAAAQAEPMIERLGCPGMGTGVGRMAPTIAAEQMRAAWDEWREAPA